MRIEKSVFPIVCIFMLEFSVSIVNAGNEMLPKNKSELEGWNNFKIVKGFRCKDCCSLKFPKDFGSKKSELNILVSIIQKRENIKHDVGCIFTLAYDVLDQLKYVAIKHDCSDVIDKMLFPEKIGGFSLSGELADIYETEYLIPILTNRNTTIDLNHEQSKAIISKICYAWENPGSDPNMDLAKIRRSLRNKKLFSLAKGLENNCK